MDRLKQIEAFVSPAIIGRRLDALESRLGVRLLLRTTRKLTITFEGQAFLEDCQKTLNDLANAEAAVSLGGVRASGQLRVSAPSGFGRRHVAPLVGDFMAANPEVTVNLDLSDRLVDLLNENIDCAIRIGELTDSIASRSVSSAAGSSAIRRAGKPIPSRSVARSSATMGLSCTTGRWPAGGWPGARCGKSGRI